MQGANLSLALQQPFDAPYQVMLNSAQGPTRTLKDCNQYLAVEGHIYSAGSDMDYRSLLSDGVRCDALALFRKAGPARTPVFADFFFSQISPALLPPEVDLNISDESLRNAKAAAAAGKSLADVDSAVRLHATGVHTARLTAPGWTASLVDYGHADVLGDGTDDLLLRRDAAATSGTYAATDLFVLRKSPNGRLVVVQQLPPVLH